MSTAINYTEVSPTGMHYDLHCNPCAQGKSKEEQIKSDLIRCLHRALLIKALCPTMHLNSLEMTPYGERNLNQSYISLCLVMAGELSYVDTVLSICRGRGKIDNF